MNLKNINNSLVFLFLFFCISCSTDNTNLVYIPTQIDEIEDQDIISNIYFSSQGNSKDFYSRNTNFLWKSSTELNKNFILTISMNLNSELNVSNFVVDNDYIFFINEKSNFVKASLLDGVYDHEVTLDFLFDKDLSQPISIAKQANFFYAGFGNGTIIKFDESGKIYWNLDFQDLLRTPIKIQNNKIIAMFNSNRIISINLDDGSITWEYYYELDKYSLSSGGVLFLKDNILFFVMPNGRIGAIDTIIGEKIKLDFLDQIKQQNLFNYNYKANIYTYDSLFSFLENFNTIYTFNFDTKKFLLFNDKLSSINSHSFIGNTLLILDNNNLLKAYNLNNKKIFWQTDLLDKLSKNEKIVQTFISNDDIIVFFSKGTVLQLNKLNGELIFKQNLKLSDIAFVSSYNENYMLSLMNGKTVFYKQ